MVVGLIGSALVAGGMSLLGSVLGKPEQQDPVVNVTGVTNNLQPNAPMFPLPSDKRVKEHVSGPDDEIKEFLNAISPVKYDYKDSYEDGSSPNYGVVAQDLEKSSIGRDMLSKDENGKLEVDYGPRSVEKLLSIVGSLNKRLSELENR